MYLMVDCYHIVPVSYTHLDVYKRQIQRVCNHWQSVASSTLTELEKT